MLPCLTLFLIVSYTILDSAGVIKASYEHIPSYAHKILATEIIMSAIPSDRHLYCLLWILALRIAMQFEL